MEQTELEKLKKINCLNSEYPIIVSVKNVSDFDIDDVELLNKNFTTHPDIQYNSCIKDTTYQEIIDVVSSIYSDKLKSRMTMFIISDPIGLDVSENLDFDFKTNGISEKIKVHEEQNQRDRTLSSTKYCINKDISLKISKLKKGVTLVCRIYFEEVK